MPGGRPPLPQAIRDQILPRLAAGERLKHICAEPGMPHPMTVTQWAREKPWFGDAYRAALRQGAYRRRCVVDWEKARELLLRVNEGGERIRDVLAEPGMPSHDTYLKWRRYDAEFQREMAVSNAARQQLNGYYRKLARQRPFDPALADRIVARVYAGVTLAELRRRHPELPSLPVIRRWRREQPQFAKALRFAISVANRRRQRTRLCNEATIEAVTDRLERGQTLAAIGRRADMPSRTTLYAWLRTRPDFYVAVETALRIRADALADGAMDIVDDGLPGRSRRFRARTVQTERLDSKAARCGPGQKWRYPKVRDAAAAARAEQ